MQFVPHGLRKAGAGVIHEAEPLEEPIAKLAAFTQIGQDHLEPARYVQEDVGSNVIKIANGGLDAARHGPAVVDVIRPAVV